MTADDHAGWVFGYGSLVWRPAFAFTEQRPGWISGWSRRFWQSSTDHRGVPEAPGRVVTLIEDPDAVCWGMAYRVAPADQRAVLARLDHREQGGYDRHRLTVHFVDAQAVAAIVYVATADNDNYAGPATLEAIAAQVRRSRGPSGDNTGYVLALADALAAMGARDAHVEALAALLRDPA